MMRALFYLLIFLFISCNSSEEQNDTDVDATQLDTAIGYKMPNKDMEIVNLNNQSNKLTEANYLSANSRGSVDLILEELNDLTHAKTLIGYVPDSIKDWKEATEKLKGVVLYKQMKDLPVLRKNYAIAAKQKLWEEDIDVTIGGPKNTIITFIGGRFAANRNKQEFKESLENMFSDLRFKRVIFKWYKGQDDYTYYDFNTPNDTDL